MLTNADKGIKDNQNWYKLMFGVMSDECYDLFTHISHLYNH